MAVSWGIEVLFLWCVWNSLAYKNSRVLEIKQWREIIQIWLKNPGYNYNLAKIRKFYIFEAKSWVLHFFFSFRNYHIMTYKTWEYNHMLY